MFVLRWSNNKRTFMRQNDKITIDQNTFSIKHGRLSVVPRMTQRVLGVVRSDIKNTWL